MMKKISILLFCCTSISYGQVNTKSSIIQGVWEHSMPNQEGSIFKIVNGAKCLEFTYIPDYNESDLTLYKMIVGFQDSVSSSDDNEEIDTSNFRADGLYYTEIIDEEDIEEDGLVKKPNFIIPYYFECDGQVLSMAAGKLFEYDKILELPYYAIEYLYRRGNLDKRDYIKEYLNLRALVVKPSKCAVYSKPDKQTNVRLNGGDVVIVTEEAGKWLKVKYGENGVGWIKKEAIKQ